MTDALRTQESFSYVYEADGGPLTYLDTGGNGPAVVLLHGGFVDHRMWHAQIPALARTHRVIAPDARGHGDSSVAKAPFRPADDVAALMRHLGVGPAVLVGLSMGGATAVDTALEHPTLVRALAVSGVGTSEPEWRDPWVLERQAEQVKALTAGDAARWVEEFTLFAAGPHRSLDDVDPDVVQLLREMQTYTISKHTGAEPDHRVPVTDTWARAAGVDVPVLALNGALDSDDHLEMADRLARTVRDGRTLRIEGTAHYPNMERPDLFNAHLADFLESL
ncbi:hydrolase [Streptomyces spiroverticillatus]|uniref:Hydrolase n=1 Tax=Streptomyces finlayi TaxID=67296 RepID=A0A918X4V8_9ACTN|nr:alpha/beta hydrolase [Streptomyces finlayi]GHA32572.1 hydrolase [Streptomyces spiroverticillatus]GHD10484.1 hydrolase [Streptomyces finlayi]